MLCRCGPPGDGGGHAAVECAGGGDQAEDGDPSTIPGAGDQAEGGHWRGHRGHQGRGGCDLGLNITSFSSEDIFKYGSSLGFGFSPPRPPSPSDLSPVDWATQLHLTGLLALAPAWLALGLYTGSSGSLGHVVRGGNDISRECCAIFGGGSYWCLLYVESTHHCSLYSALAFGLVV